ncbi:MAG: polysaccharide biosynthesis protein PslG, partial [Solirubrobacteraceae bacterium]|nr:polysaccharide biosynthesis protein PslG [Solirubrobacteraceae bacterium]
MPANRGRACARAVRHAVLLAGIALACGPATASAGVVPPDFYGVNSGSAVITNAALRGPALQAMAAGGLRYVRVDASWGGIEPAAPVAGVHRYVWGVYDTWVADLARHGLRWYPMVGYSAPWASSVPGDAFTPPAGDADFAAFARALAARYGPGGQFWAEHLELPSLPVTVYGIWNEPSNEHFWHGPEATPARYMSLYVAARAAIRSYDVSARVATAGLLDSGTVDGDAFLRAMLDGAPAARGQIDAVGWHPYVGDVDQVLESVAKARATLTRYGLGSVPIEISEVGMHSGYAPAQRAQWLHDLAMELPNAGLNVTRLLPYVWSGDPLWQITDPDGSPGLIGSAYFAGIADAAAFTSQPLAPATTAVTTAAASKPKARTAKACKVARSRKGRAARRGRKAKRCTSQAARTSRAKARAKAARARAKATRARAARAKAARARGVRARAARARRTHRS